MKRIISLLLSILLLASVSAYAESTQEPTSDSFAEEAESLYNLGKQYDKADSSDEDYAKAYDYYKKVEHDFMMEPESRKKFEKCLNIIRLYDEELDDM